MKKLLLLFTFLSLTQFSWGQDNPCKDRISIQKESDTEISNKIKTSVFTLDLGIPNENSLWNCDCDKKNIDKLILPTKKLLSLNLVNGNPYKYKYVINSKFVNFFDQDQKNYLDDVPKLISPKNSDKTLETVNEKIEEKKSDNKKWNDSIAMEKAKIKKLSKKSLPYRKQKTQEFQKNIALEQNKIDANEREIVKLEAFKEIIYNSKSNFSKTIIQNNQEIGDNLLIDINNLDNDLKNVLDALKILKTKAIYQKSEINKYILKLSAAESLKKDEFIENRDLYSTKYEELIGEIMALNNDAAKNDAIKDQYLESRKDFDKTMEDIKSEIVKMYQLKFDNYTFPIDINGKNIDLVEITMQRFDKSNASPTPDEYKYNIYIRGGLKIDISAGLFLTSLMDKEYETQDVIIIDNGVNVNRKVIYEKQKGQYDFGFGSMINISLRGGSWVRPGLNFGALFTANQKFQILSGIGLALGKEERIIVHFGCSMGSVAEISSQYIADGTTPYDLGVGTTVPTNDKFKFGHFFGITYNLSKQKKQTD